MVARTPQTLQGQEEPAQLHLLPTEDQPPTICTAPGTQPPRLLMMMTLSQAAAMDLPASVAVTAHPQPQLQRSRRDRMAPLPNETITVPRAMRTTLPHLQCKTGTFTTGQHSERMAQS